jgi:hypothetical protein
MIFQEAKNSNFQEDTKESFIKNPGDETRVLKKYFT